MENVWLFVVVWLSQLHPSLAILGFFFATCFWFGYILTFEPHDKDPSDNCLDARRKLKLLAIVFTILAFCGLLMPSKETILYVAGFVYGPECIERIFKILEQLTQ